MTLIHNALVTDIKKRHTLTHMRIRQGRLQFVACDYVCKVHAIIQYEHTQAHM